MRKRQEKVCENEKKRKIEGRAIDSEKERVGNEEERETIVRK